MTYAKFAICKRVLGVFTIFIVAAAMTACGGAADLPQPETGVSTAPSPSEDRNPSEIPADPSDEPTEDSAHTDSPAEKIYTCSLTQHKQGTFIFYYTDDRLTKTEYISYIKGVPEEIESRERIKAYSGITMVDMDSYILFQMDMSQDGLRYLKENHALFADLTDSSWETIRPILESNGYTCSES